MKKLQAILASLVFPLLPAALYAAPLYTVTDLGTLGGISTYGYGINASGEVTGFSSTTDGSATQAFLSDGTTHDLGSLGGTKSEGLGINDSGQMTGYAFPL